RLARERPTRPHAVARHNPDGQQARAGAIRMMAQLWARNGEVELAALEWQAGALGLPLVIALHGMGLRGEVWAGLAERLAERCRAQPRSDARSTPDPENGGAMAAGPAAVVRGPVHGGGRRRLGTAHLAERSDGDAHRGDARGAAVPGTLVLFRGGDLSRAH